MPYISEKIYQDLNRRADVPSVHLADWPQSKDMSNADIELLRKWRKVRELASIGMALRKAANIAVRQPLNALRLRIMD